MDARTRWGAGLWLVRPAYLLSEVVVGLATTGGYSFVDDTVSDLGATGCEAAYCSPWHAVMNGSFVVSGVLLALGALLLVRHVGPLASVLLVVAGTSSAAVGLVPVDEQPGLHTLVATPLFVLQPVALLVLAQRWRGRAARSRALLAAAALTAVGAVGFIVLDGGSGAWERLALWPVLVALAAAAAFAGPPRGQAHIPPVCPPPPSAA